MNFKHYIKLCEEPLPGLGLVRTYRDTYRNEKSYQKALDKRNKFCFNYQLNARCKTYRDYKNECYKMKYVRRILCNRLPEDIVKYLLEFYCVPQIRFIPRTNYCDIYPKDTYKWYILISNILYTMNEKYHQKVLNMYKELPQYNYEDTFNRLLKSIGELRVLQDDGVLYTCDKSLHIFDVAAKYKKYLNDKLFYMYYNICL